MPNQPPKKSPENLIEFAKLAKISSESLDQILDKLKQAGINISDPQEKLSPQMKAKLLAFFKRKSSSSQVLKQTHTSHLQTHSNHNASVTITTVSRKVVPEPAVEEIEPQASEKNTDSLDVQDNHKIEPAVTIEAVPNKKPSDFSKKKSKLETPLKRPKKKLATPEALELPDEEDDSSRHDTLEVPRQKKALRPPSLNKTAKPIYSRNISIFKAVSVTDLAKKLAVKERVIVNQLKQIGVTVEYADELIEQDIAALLVEEMGHQPILIQKDAEELAMKESIEQKMGPLKPRPPIITVMGHVDHGKTSLLDKIRKEKVAAGEAGGITQRIGAYQVDTSGGKITFLDTPGHAAFTAMRARGANLTDIVVLVVAANEGIKPQTKEAVEHAQAAGVPIIVAVNKMDVSGASMSLAQSGLAEYNLFEGETPFLPISAKTGEGIDELLETIFLEAEDKQFTAPDEGPAQGTIIEARVDKGQGTVATLMVQKGRLKKGDMLLAGTSFGKIKAISNEYGKPLTSAGPSTPVEILGLSTPPQAGEEAIVVPNEREGRAIIQLREAKARTLEQTAQTNNVLESMMDPFKSQPEKLIHIILKADVQGSAEAVKQSILKLATSEVQIKILMAGVGIISESDVNLAIASQAIIFGFNVKADSAAKRIIQREKIGVYYYQVIYELLDEINKIVYGLTAPQVKETILGEGKIREIFKSGKNIIVAGCLVTQGSINLKNNIRIKRQTKTLFEGKLTALRRFKDNVKEVQAGTECGISFKSSVELLEGDILESYETTLTKAGG